MLNCREKFHRWNIFRVFQKQTSIEIGGNWIHKIRMGWTIIVDYFLRDLSTETTKRIHLFDLFKKCKWDHKNNFIVYYFFCILNIDQGFIHKISNSHFFLFFKNVFSPVIFFHIPFIGKNQVIRKLLLAWRRWQMYINPCYLLGIIFHAELMA